MTKRMKYSKKSLRITKVVKIQDDANSGQRIVLGIKLDNMPFLLLPLLHQNKQVLGLMSVNSKLGC